MRVTKAEKQRRALEIVKVKANLAAHLVETLDHGHGGSVTLADAMDPYLRLNKLESKLQKLMMYRVGFYSDSVLQGQEDAALDLREAITKYVDVACDDFVTNGGELWNIDAISEVIAQYSRDYLGRGLPPADVDVYRCSLIDPQHIRLESLGLQPSGGMSVLYERQEDGSWHLILVEDEDGFEVVSTEARSLPSQPSL